MGFGRDSHDHVLRGLRDRHAQTESSTVLPSMVVFPDLARRG